MSLYSYLHPDGGWRQVEIVALGSGTARVRDWHRGDVYWVPHVELVLVEKYRGPQP